ncbi:MAG: hypothetical protein OEV21_03530 [Thermoplasmata archaeon]|nr:hypothetical protein [Thermoplasmata archaeon]
MTPKLQLMATRKPKRRYADTNTHGVISQKVVSFRLIKKYLN